ncbi:hypothetical protein D9757_003941 [Collybiopsis confluens]|uniref:Deacetylase sirtuin-type domain-containing protein n=1 Tax=Collybiopsis confluens TaxID=2823264 RepID=A0A8H5HWL5_9AGAR|nr:hypothetical protein D9757_003941 [Collybiopsis confluens]
MSRALTVPIISMNPSLSTETQILICGAGPTGLAAAISLVCSGVAPSQIIIVNDSQSNANASRAVAIHAATLEALDKIGCASRLVELGVKARGWGFGSRDSVVFSTDFKYIDGYTKYPFVLMLSQSATERVFEERLTELGFKVRKGWRVVGMRDTTAGEGIDVSFESGEIVKTEYVIGADGARSTIRQLSGINFSDPDGKAAEDSIDNREDIVCTAITLSDNGMFLVFPIGNSTTSQMLHNSGEMIYRIGFNVPRDQGEPPSQPPKEYLQANMDQLGPLFLSSNPKVNPFPVLISKVHWSTRFRTHAAIADVSFKQIHGGFVFLVGDAAHIHSPAGGQGMNLGLRDAVGLGPVLARHIRGLERIEGSKQDISALENYAAARHAQGLKVIRLTKRLMGTDPHYRSALGAQVGAMLPQALFGLDPLWTHSPFLYNLDPSSIKMPSSDTKEFHRVLSTSRNILVVSGAGLSAASEAKVDAGVNTTPQFWPHSPLGMKISPEYGSSSITGEKSGVRSKLPNPGHHALARLCMPQWRRLVAPNATVTHVTQNIDGLCIQALNDLSYSSDEEPDGVVIEMHGNLFDVVCTAFDCDYQGHVEPLVRRADLPHCPKCQQLLRPDVVWFGERPKRIQEILVAADSADLCLVVGTSSLVQPASKLPERVHANGGQVAVFNVEATTNHSDEADFLFVGPCELELTRVLGL